MSLLPVGIGSSGSYEIAKSLRFRASASPRLERTFGGSGSRRKWTWSAWFKIGAVGGTQILFSRDGGVGTFTSVAILNTGAFRIYDVLSSVERIAKTSTALLRDPSAHYHLFVSVDTENATAADRAQIWVNGVRVTSFSSSVDPSLNYDTVLNASGAHQIGNFASANPADGYLSEIHFIDGQALTPSSFGETDPNTGVWVPRRYTGTYGTNGFYLPFNDGTNLTNLCLDRSGNGNNWTATNVSLTAGATYDWMDDTPTNNYAVLNPLTTISASGGTGTVTSANLNTAATGSSNGTGIRTHSNIAFNSGDYYFEVTVLGSSGASYSLVGVQTTSTTNACVLLFCDNTNQAIIQTSAGNVQTNLGFVAVNDIISVAVESSGWATFRKNNVIVGVRQSFSVDSPIYAVAGPRVGNAGASLASFAFNFGQRPFAYTPPTGFLPLCTKNLTGTTITTSGSFTGNASADGPFVWLNGVPTAMTINGNAVTFATHADRTAGGFKVRTSSSSYNVSGTNNYTITTTGAAFKNARAQVNP